ncbi:hypothetical protein [uncultured Bacteroides sp.]|uniref:hypothetical protein n=1 Tax=uncultured Bacteroides sp. TaxID=162156 RepID=UPI00263699F3|nr:hypothetical protein [uncultured Bacteroides sp.]
MVVTNTFYLTAESYRQWLEANPTAVSVDANNVQKSPLVIRSWSGEGSDKTAYPVYLTLQVESVAGTSVEVLYTYKSTSKVSEYTYTLTSDKYATANRITVSAYDDAARTKAVGSVQLNILADNPVPYPRSEEWSTSLTYKNGEYLKQGDVLYMWTSRVPGNTTTDPKTWIQNNPTSKLWSVYPYNTLLAGQILLFEFALLGKAVFKDEYMMSQYGRDANWNQASDYRQFGTDAFTPNILFNFLTGAGHLAAGNIYWDEMGEMYRRTMGRFIWRDIHAEGIDAGLIDGDDYNIDLKRGTFLDISSGLGEVFYVVLPSASAYPGITISFRWALLTRSGATHPIKCADGIWALNKDSQEYALSTTIDAEGKSGNATIQSMEKNGGYEWVADRDFSPE